MTEQELSELIRQRFDTLDADFKQLTEEVRKTNERVDRTNDRVETYQKASQQVVNLAFGLILTAAALVVRKTPEILMLPLIWQKGAQSEML